MKQKPSSLSSRVSSMRFAISGILQFFREEPNARIHFVANCLVFLTAHCLRLSGREWIALIMAAGIVWICEIFNTAIERIMDHLSPEYHESVGFIKDLAAGAVLISAIIAALTGLIIFMPKIT